MLNKDIEPVYQAIGARIRMIRDVLGVDQGTLAKRVGSSRPAIANMEVGRQRIAVHQIAKLAEALGTTPKGIMKGIWW